MARSISKRLRFEIFKRDEFACQYCGAHPPQVVLELDHVIPVSLGGEDDADNLVTSCFACNRGKSATPLDAVPKSLADKAADVAEREEQLKGYSAVLAARRERVEDEIWQAFGHWRGQTETTHAKFSSMKTFIERLGINEVLEAIDITLGAEIYSSANEWKYFCGVCWRKIKGDR
ncbi:HNH endonuclease [Novosphingobium sp. NBM11]|uniref:HNH endonuclease n=1 Tax=Novosphingobium sp. NBM11 TaxID=2596914 RepID=UPI00189204D7|nr:HNH endonuclease signature motif containing protein [Novosphingobium sp. NBM11]MBF5091299.1 HNH endonuclease [Novosphingobium sp. NBM11]